MPRNSTLVYTKQQRLAELAAQSPQMGFTSLAYLMDLEWLREAYRRTRKDAAVGVDGQTAADYERELEANLRALLERAKSGQYQAPPVKRVYLPKPGRPEQRRPVGMPMVAA
jgi:retron-type reverse transcriptase